MIRGDPETLILNPDGLRVYSLRLAEAVAGVLRQDKFPVVLGGDCSNIIGIMLALRRGGRYGLIFIDGHADFYQPEAEPNGEVASMDLAILSGRGPDVIANIDGLRPLVRDEDVVAFGFRDVEEQGQYGSQDIRATGIHAFDLEQVRALGVTAAAREALEKLQVNKLGGFWIHLDADVRNDKIMPAVDYRLDGGLDWDELTAVLIDTHVVGSGCRDERRHLQPSSRRGRVHRTPLRPVPGRGAGGVMGVPVFASLGPLGIRPLLFVLAGGLVAGTLDILFACAFWRLRSKVPALRVLQSVAAGLLGRASFAGGVRTGALGLALHYLIAITMSTVYYLAARYWSLLWQQPLIYGMAYGLLLYVAMNLVVVPLSAAPPASRDPLWIALSILAHVVLVGIPCAIFAQQALART